MNQKSIFLKAVLTKETMYPNLEKKDSPIILKENFSLRADQFIFTSIAPNL